MNEIIKNSKKKLDVVKIYSSSDIYETEKNNNQKKLIKINDDINYEKPKKNIISLDEDNEIGLNKDKDKDKKDKSNQNRIFVFK